jgi:hypothetical protein
MTLSLPPANNCSFTTSSSKTIQSGANSARSSASPEPAMECAQRPGQSVRSAPPKPPFPSSRRKVVPCSAGHASSSGGHRFHPQLQPARLPKPEAVHPKRNLSGRRMRAGEVGGVVSNSQAQACVRRLVRTPLQVGLQAQLFAPATSASCLRG